MNPFAALSGRSVSFGSSVDFQAAILAPGKLLNFDGSSPNGEADICDRENAGHQIRHAPRCGQSP
jgi:hypothetical protein